ncbi:hypothetical protein MAR_014696, partial [Mya arenaria]
MYIRQMPAMIGNHSLGNNCNHIVGGDFNCTFDNSLDRKGAATADVKADEGCQELKALCNKLNLEDVWRRRNQGTKCFTFIRNNAKSRIDFFLSSKNLTPEIIEKISNIKQLIADYYDSKLEAHKLRSKANLIQHNEKSSDFFFSLEKQRGKNKLWHHIKTDSGAIKYGIVSILEEQTKYYKKLLNSEGTDS